MRPSSSFGMIRIIFGCMYGMHIAATASVLSLEPKGITMAPLNHTAAVVFQCEVEGGDPLWNIGSHQITTVEEDKFHDDGSIFINKTGRYSVITITESGLDTFTGSTPGCSKINITCLVKQTESIGTVDGLTSSIMRFGSPPPPTGVQVSPTTKHVSWKRPHDLCEDLPFYYTVSVNDWPEINTTKEGLDVHIPDCYLISVVASNEAGRSEPAIISNSKPSCRGKSPNHLVTAEVMYTDSSTDVYIQCKFNKDSLASSCVLETYNFSIPRDDTGVSYGICTKLNNAKNGTWVLYAVNSDGESTMVGSSVTQDEVDSVPCCSSPTAHPVLMAVLLALIMTSIFLLKI